MVEDTSGDYDAVANWRSSAIAIPIGGSPGQIDPAQVPGDINGDGATDRRDAAILVRHLGRTDNSHRDRGDLDSDGATTLVDLAMLLGKLDTALPSPQEITGPLLSSSEQIHSRSAATDVVFSRRTPQHHSASGETSSLVKAPRHSPSFSRPCSGSKESTTHCFCISPMFSMIPR